MDSRFASIRYANCLLNPLHGNDELNRPLAITLKLLKHFAHFGFS